jgi:hypothetical protein
VSPHAICHLSPQKECPEVLLKKNDESAICWITFAPRREVCFPSVSDGGRYSERD